MKCVQRNTTATREQAFARVFGELSLANHPFLQNRGMFADIFCEFRISLRPFVDLVALVGRLNAR